MNDKNCLTSASLLIISGPSGVGKTTVCNELLARPGFARVVTVTTRAARPGEVHGEDYWFFSESEFTEKIAAGYFLEHANVHGRRYGTPKQHVLDLLNEGRSVLLNIDVQGAETIRREQDLPIKTIFLMPPDLKELERRLRSRATESEESVARRLAEAQKEIDHRDYFDFTVVNSSLAEAVSLIEQALQLCVDSRC